MIEQPFEHITRDFFLPLFRNNAKRSFGHNTDDFEQHLKSKTSVRTSAEQGKAAENMRLTSAAAMVVSSALVSYAGATSTISAETIFRPSRPRRIVLNSRVDHPPVSGVPVAGAKAGSIESI